MTICSASTFCLLPAIASNGTVYYPITDLVGHPDSPSSSFSLGPHVNWIYDPPLVKGKFYPWSNVKFPLESREMTREDIEGHLIKGHGKEVFYVKNFSRHSFPNMDTFEGLGFSWDDIWQLSDPQVNSFPKGVDLSISMKGTF